jgi:hypothetical protein
MGGGSVFVGSGQHIPSSLESFNRIEDEAS